jgi:hypothetical protein
MISAVAQRWMNDMAYSASGYHARAEECVRLANLAVDELIRKELLTLRQSYLQTAERLQRIADLRGQPAGRN